MNWNKVQNIFIIIFLILNICLWYYNKLNEDSYELSKEQKTRLVNILEKNNIIVAEYFPKFKPMHQLKVSPYIVDEKDERELVKSIFQDINNIKISMPDEGKKYKKNNKVLYLFTKGKNEGIISYTDEGKENYIKQLTEEKALEEAQQFIKNKFSIFTNVEWKLTYKEKINHQQQAYIFQFNENYQGYLLNSSSIKLFINKKGVFYAEAKRAIPEKLLREKIKLSPVDEVVYSMLDDEVFMKNIKNKYKSIKINSIELCYDAQYNKKYLDPYYKICLANGIQYLANARIGFNNNKSVNIRNHVIMNGENVNTKDNDFFYSLKSN